MKSFEGKILCFMQRTEPEPIMLLFLPIIPSRNSQNFYPLFLFYSHASPIIPVIFFKFLCQ